MRFRLADLNDAALDAAADQLETHGYFMIEGVDQAITKNFLPVIAERMQVSVAELQGILDPESPPMILPVEIRQRMSRIESTPELQAALLGALGPLFRRLIGPFAHVSSTFHGQFKGGEVKAVDHGGYDPKAQYLEVQGQYLIHQDFAGAAIPTSPCGLTLWTPLNSCVDWNLRLYPGSHRHGLLCQDWIKLDDPRLAVFGEPIDIKAERGTAVVFNSLLLHSSSNPGSRRRVSCDIRFFPLCGFLPSQVHLLGDDVLGTFRRGLSSNDGPTLRAPYLEAAAFLGLRRSPEPCPPYSVLNWANFLQSTLQGDPDAAWAHLTRFTNTEQGINGVDAYAKFHGRPVHHDTMNGLLDKLRAIDPTGPEVVALQERVGQLAVAAK